MSRAVEGKNVTVEIKRGGTYLPYACATSCTLHITTELIARTSVGQGSSAKYKARMTDWNMELSGVTHILPKTDMWTVFQLSEETVRKSGVDIRTTFVDGEGNIKTISGFAFIPDIEITAGADGFSEDTIQFQGSGMPGLFGELPPDLENTLDVKWNLYKENNGSTGFTDNDLIGRTEVAVWRGDPIEVITTGTPTFQQVKFDSSIGQLLFGVPLAIGEYIFYQYK